MQLARPLLSMSLAACVACASSHVREPADAPTALVDRAIAAAGGAAALDAARALRWEGLAVVHVGTRNVVIRGTWEIQPPDSAIVATYDTARGPSTIRRLIVAGPRGYIESNGTFAPMPEALHRSERDEFALYDIMRLVPLRAHDVVLRAIPPDSLGQRGVEIVRPGRATVNAYVNASGRLAHLMLRIPDGQTGAMRRQDLWLDGLIEASGMRWPRTIRITMDGAPFFDLSISSLVVSRQLQSAYLDGRVP